MEYRMPGIIAKIAKKAALAAAALVVAAPGPPSAWDGKMMQLSVTGNCLPYQVLYYEGKNNCTSGNCDYFLQVVTPNRTVHIVITLNQPPGNWKLLAPSLQGDYKNTNIQNYPLLRVPTAGPAPGYPVPVTLFCPFY